MPEPLVSIIVPAYNEEQRISAALNRCALKPPNPGHRGQRWLDR